MTPQSAKTVADPVCGAAVGSNAEFRTMSGSLLYCFCSRACLERFNADPVHYAFSAVSRSTGDASASAASASGQPRDLDADPDHAFSREMTDWSGEIHGSIPLAPVPVVAPAPTPAPGLLDRLMPGSERRFARRVSRELRALHAAVAQANPGLRGRDLYRRIAMERLKTDAKGADALLQKADESFAWWPTTREITYIDVVHMIAIVEYHQSHGKAHWIIADMGRIVAEEIGASL